MRPIKVIALLQFFEPGGIEWMVARWAVQLKSQDRFLPEIFVYDQHSGVVSLDSWSSNRGVTVHRQQKSAGFSWRTVHALCQLIRTEPACILHAHHLGALIYAVLVKFFSLNEVHVLYTQHSFLHLQLKSSYLWIEKFFCFFADQITAVSPQVAQQFADLKITPQPVMVIPNGAQFPKQPLLQKSQQLQLRQQLIQQESAPALDPSKRWVLYLSRIHRGKGQNKMLQAWAAMDHANLQLIFICPNLDAAFYSELQSAAQNFSKNQVVFLPPTQQASQWMLAADLFCSFSESEGWPLAPMEALGAGTPCVLSDIPGHLMYSRWAEFFSLDDLQRAAQLMQTLLRAQQSDNDWVQQRDRSWQKSADLRQQFSLQQMCLRYVEVYTLILPDYIL
jgi:glycosyltransferase involved in cell wall biosynthesis